MGFPTRSDTNQAVQPHKMARGLKIWIEEVEELYYPCSENKGADQLRAYWEADLRLCFGICKKVVKERTGLMVRASDSGSGDPGSILGRVGVLFP